MENLGNKHYEAILKPRRVFLEIGTNELPVIRLGKTELQKFDDEYVYIGIDIDKKALQKAKTIFGQKKNINFINVDAKNLPFSDESIDEVFIGNVIGDPSISEKEKDKFIEEAKRIVKKDGVLIFKENSTPAFTGSLPNRNELLNDLARRHGLTIERLIDIDTSSQEWAETIKQYDALSSPSAGSGAFIAFLKLTQKPPTEMGRL